MLSWEICHLPYIVYLFFCFAHFNVNTCMLFVTVFVIKHIQGRLPYWSFKHLQGYTTKVGLQRKSGIRSKWQEDKGIRDTEGVGSVFCFSSYFTAVREWGLVGYFDGKAFWCVSLNFFFLWQVLFISKCCLSLIEPHPGQCTTYGGLDTCVSDQRSYFFSLRPHCLNSKYTGLCTNGCVGQKMVSIGGVLLFWGRS